jgi:CMP/dCMP kinase
VTVIAIDGPAGAGKSTIAKLLADKLSYRYVDTGAMYRAVALAAISAGVDLGDADAVGEIALRSTIEASQGKVVLDGHDVTTRVREGDVTEAVSRVAAHPTVRDVLVGLQRAEAASGGVVMEGRDIGSVVVPDAQIKVFLTASIQERARRRWEQDGRHGEMAEIVASIAQRDARDSQRSSSPLIKSEGAVEVDTTGKSIAEVVDEIVALVGSR